MARTKTKIEQDIPEGYIVEDAVIGLADRGDAYEPTANERPAKPDLKHEPVERIPGPKITVLLPDGSKAKYYDEGNSRGIAIQIDHPDESFRPSEQVLEPLKEAHEGRKRHHWYPESKAWVKRNIQDDPVGERADSIGRFEKLVKNRKEEIEQGR